jgi:hypothetical protein
MQAQASTLGASRGTLGFSKPIYDVDNGTEFAIQLTREGEVGLSKSPITILYNPKVISFVAAEQPTDNPTAVDAQANEEKGELSIQLASGPNSGNPGSPDIATLRMKAVSTGTSYLVYRASAESADTPQMRASRVVVK